MYFGNRHLWRYRCTTSMAGLNMDEQVKAGEWIGKHLFAFPANHFDLAEIEHGLTMRDYFAAKAMQSLILAEHSKNEFNEEQAAMAYEVADAMLKERTKK